MMPPEKLRTQFDPATGEIHGVPLVKRHLLDLHGCFADATAYASATLNGNPLIYTVASVEPAAGEGDLFYGIGRILPGRVGDEYYLTKGHLHAWREAAEVYIGLHGEGVMLLEDEETGVSRMLTLRAESVVYVPGRTAHRTINTGRVPLTYVGVYPARAGHDYEALATRNFRCAVIERDGRPVMVERREFRA